MWVIEWGKGHSDEGLLSQHLGRQRQDDLMFEASLVYVVRP